MCSNLVKRYQIIAFRMFVINNNMEYNKTINKIYRSIYEEVKIIVNMNGVICYINKMY